MTTDLDFSRGIQRFIDSNTMEKYMKISEIDKIGQTVDCADVI